VEEADEVGEAPPAADGAAAEEGEEGTPAAVAADGAATLRAVWLEVVPGPAHSPSPRLF
jgi:hypothetical protein